MDVAIKIENLSKLYHIGVQIGGDGRTFRETIMDAATGPWRRLRRALAHRQNLDLTTDDGSPKSAIWALKDIDLEIAEGDVVGLIGRNGSGKSTLLKILSRVTRPTSGRALLRGRVGSLLEVGTGFHPELTGRENIQLNGAILGMSRREIARKFDEIVDFSGIEQFLDTPSKNYSSGMFIRLAFAVAAHLDTEILIVDEVLAVGDVEFQRKCLGKLGDLNRSGRTVIFVTHNMGIMQSLCKRAVLLSHGRIVSQGERSSVVADYLASTRGEVDGRFDPGAFRESGMMPVIRRIVTQTEEGVPTDQFLSGSGMNIEIEYDSPVPLRKPSFSMIFESATGERLFSIQTLSHHGFLSSLPQSGTIRCQIPALPLIQGLYYITFFVESRQERIDSLERAIAFSIVGSDYFGTGFVPQEVHGRILVAANWDLPIATPALRLATESSG